LCIGQQDVEVPKKAFLDDFGFVDGQKEQFLSFF
jgi:hypothetical protein